MNTQATQTQQHTQTILSLIRSNLKHSNQHILQLKCLADTLSGLAEAASMNTATLNCDSLDMVFGQFADTLYNVYCSLDKAMTGIANIEVQAEDSLDDGLDDDTENDTAIAMTKATITCSGRSNSDNYIRHYIQRLPVLMTKHMTNATLQRSYGVELPASFADYTTEDLAEIAITDPTTGNAACFVYPKSKKPKPNESLMGFYSRIGIRLPAIPTKYFS